MGAYRDDLESAHLRIETLEAKLAASEAEAIATQTEANELRRKVERLERELGELQTDVPTLVTSRPAVRWLGGRRHAALTAVLIASCALGFAAAYLSHSVHEQVGSEQAHPPLDELEARPELPAPPPPPYLPVRKPRPAPRPSSQFLPEGRIDPSEFNRGAARVALAAAAREAAKCPSKVTGRGKIVVTFAPNGGVTSAAIGPPFNSSPAAPCILAAFRQITVPAFEGGPVTVSKSFFIK